MKLNNLMKIMTSKLPSLQMSFKDNITSALLRAADQKFPEFLRHQDPSLLRDLYASTYGRDFTCKFKTRNPNDYNSTVQVAKQLYMKTLDHELSSKPWQPLKLGETEYNTSYVHTIKQDVPEDTRHPAVISICKSCQIGLDEQPAIQPMLNSIAKHLDPFISTTKLIHTKFSESDKQGIAANDCITLYNSKDLAGQDFSIHTEPPHDKLPFKRWPRLRLVPHFVKHIPNKGLKSEMQDKYVHPYQQGWSNSKWTDAIESPFKLIPSTPGKFIGVPNSYYSEYIHLGNAKPLRSTIDLGAPSLKEKIH